MRASVCMIVCQLLTNKDSYIKVTENFQNNRKVPTVKGLKADANSRGLKGYSRLNKAELADLLNPLNEPVPEINVLY